MNEYLKVAMKHKIYKRYRTGKKRGGQRYSVGNKLRRKNFGAFIKTSNKKVFPVPEDEDSLLFIAKKTLESPETFLGQIQAGSDQQREIFLKTISRSDPKLVRLMKEKRQIEYQSLN